MENNKGQRIYKTIMSILLTAVITFVITTIAMYNVNGKDGIKYISTNSEGSAIGKTFQNFREFIDKYYIGDIDNQKLLEYAIKGYINGLEDEYSEYYTKEEMEDFLESTNGKYVGIGVYIASDIDNNIIVLMPIKGSPAEEAGIQSGDIISKIDGIEYKGEQLSLASSKLKEKEGTKVKIELIRKGQTIEVEVTRKTIKVNHVESKVLEGNIGYIQISTFDDGCYEEFKSEAQKLINKNIKSLIIDLRNNGGGIVDEATNIADTMLEKESTILITKGKNIDEKITKASKEKMINMPIVLLVNENTASASEILAGALKDNLENVKIIGKTTFGKGVIQTVFTLTDGSGLKLTTNEYYTPNHNAINKVGIKPDIEVEFSEDESIYNVEESKDTQLQKAIEILK